MSIMPRIQLAFLAGLFSFVSFAATLPPDVCLKALLGATMKSDWGNEKAIRKTKERIFHGERERSEKFRFYSHALALEGLAYRARSLRTAQSRRINNIFSSIAVAASIQESLKDWLYSLDSRQLSIEQINFIENLTTTIFFETGENVLRLGMLSTAVKDYAPTFVPNLNSLEWPTDEEIWGKNYYDGLNDVRLRVGVHPNKIQFAGSEWTDDLADQTVKPFTTEIRNFTKKMEIDLVLAVPSTTYKHGVSTRIGRAVAKIANLPFAPGWIVNGRGRKREQQKTIDDIRDRILNSVDSFSVNKAVKDKIVLIVDDTTASGVTLEELRRAAYDRGASRVLTLTLASFR